MKLQIRVVMGLCFAFMALGLTALFLDKGPGLRNMGQNLMALSILGCLMSIILQGLDARLEHLQKAHDALEKRLANAPPPSS